jgi:nicotinamidase-related amidase
MASRVPKLVALQPWLICLNLQREYTTPGRPLFAPHGERVASVARECLQHARASHWPIAHVQTRRVRLANGKAFSRPIEGLEPSPSEPVFATGYLSALTHAGLRAHLMETPPESVYLIGFSLAHDGLATLFHGWDLGLPMIAVEGAMGSPSIGERSAAEIDCTAFTVAASLSGLVTKEEFLGVSSATLVRLRGGRDER